MAYDNIEFLHPKGNEEWQALKRRFQGAGNNNPLENILERMRLQKCQSIIIENEYIDVDYISEFTTFYATTFIPHSMECTRVHFFTGVITEGDLFNLFEHRKHYMGYMVVRPIEAFKTGRTVVDIRFPNYSSNFLLTKTSFDVNISGTPLCVEGMPFMQQDTNVGVCAQAALWMVSLYMSQKFNYKRWTPAEISDVATRYLSYGSIKDGLTPEQMIDVMREMGFRPLQIPFSTVRTTAKRIYSYVESEIPVILILAVPPSDGHAVTVIGHTFNPKSTPIFEEGFAHNIDWIDEFYIHDDASGPLRRLPIMHRAGVNYSVENNVDSLLVPLPHEVSLRSDYAEIHSKELIQSINEIFRERGLSDYCFSDDELSDLVLRTYLRSSNTYKESLLQSNMPDFLKVEYRSRRFPKYIWVVEISKEDLLSKSKSSERGIVGEIILDSTANEEAYSKSFLVFHLYDRVVFRRPLLNDADIKGYRLSTWSSYRHLVRGRVASC